MAERTSVGMFLARAGRGASLPATQAPAKVSASLSMVGAQVGTIDRVPRNDVFGDIEALSSELM
jgi:hypothetical protein